MWEVPHIYFARFSSLSIVNVRWQVSFHVFYYYPMNNVIHSYGDEEQLMWLLGNYQIVQ